MNPSKAICVVTIGLALVLVPSCSRSPTNLKTGMTMQDAVSKMKSRGMQPQQMAYAGEHKAFDLKDGRTVVLVGNDTVDEIQVIANPEASKANRVTESVAAFKF